MDIPTVDMKTSDGTRLSVPIQEKGDTHLVLDISAHIPLLANRLVFLAPTRPISRVYHDVAALADGHSDVWVTLIEEYNIPLDRIRAWRTFKTEARRLLALHIWLDEVGV